MIMNREFLLLSHQTLSRASLQITLEYLYKKERERGSFISKTRDDKSLSASDQCQRPWRNEKPANEKRSNIDTTCVSPSRFARRSKKLAARSTISGKRVFGGGKGEEGTFEKREVVERLETTDGH